MALHSTTDIRTAVKLQAIDFSMFSPTYSKATSLVGTPDDRLSVQVSWALSSVKIPY
jgi:hypothetical protein